MLKRYIYAGLFAIVFLGLVTMFLLKRFEKITPVEVQQAIPGDAVLFAENVDFEYLTETFLPEGRMWIDFLNIAEKGNLDSLIDLTLSQIRSSESLSDYLKKEGLNLSIHKLGKDQLTPLIYLGYADDHSDHEFEHMMLTLLEEKAMVNERKYETEILYDVSGGPGILPGKFTFACTGGLCLISPSSMLVEEAIRTIHAGTDSSPDPGLQKVRETAGRYVHANLYINYKKLPDLFYPIIKESGWDRLGMLSNLASWGELDLDIKQDALILNGMTHADPNAPLFLGAFKGQSPVKMELHEVLPAGTAHFLHLGVGDRTIFKESILAYMKGIGKGQEIATERERLSQQYGFDPLDDLFRIVDDEMAWFSIEGETKTA